MSSGTDPTLDITNTTRNSEPFYSNEDVGILHEIVLLAQDLWPTLPERERLPTNALFGAYYDILPKLGLDADHDNRYARVLFKIGGLGGPRGPDGLYERFEAVLSKMGIEIELEEGRSEADSDEELREDIRSITLEQQYERPQTRRRRNSESTVWDIEPKLESSRIGHRRNSFSGRNNPPTASGQGPMKVLPPTQLYQTEEDDGSNEDDDFPDRNVRAWLASRPGEQRRGRGRSISTQGSLRIRRRSPEAVLRLSPNVPTTNPSVPSDGYQSPSEITAVTSAQEQTSSSKEPIVSFRTTKNAGDHMHTRASISRSQYLSKKQHFRLWRGRAIRLKEDNYNLDIISCHYERIFRLRRALHIWQRCIVHSQEDCETEKYYDALELRCLVVTDWNLMRKAFSHWKELTLEEVERTSIARRHILRTRTFHAWKEYTVVNEFKIRRQITKKFFLSWISRLHNASSDANLALQTYNANLAKQVYVEWFWRVCNIKTTVWWADVTKKRSLSRWILALRNTQQNLKVAEERENLKLLGNLQLWKAKYNDILHQRQEAINFIQSRLCLNAFKKWQREKQVFPARRSVEIDVNQRLLREAFSIWLHHTRQEIHAKEINHLRIARNEFSKWRHQTAVRISQSRQEEQAAKINRLKMYRAVLVIWRKQKDCKLLRTRQSQQAAAIDRHRVLREAIIAWREKTICEIFNQQQKRRAAALDRQRILREAWTIWRYKSRLQVMSSRVNERVVREAVYKWALADRICYANRFFTRRSLQGCLGSWAQKAQAFQVEQCTQQDLADEFAHKTAKFLALKRWTAHLQTLNQHETDAMRFCVPRLQRGIVSDWLGCAQHLLKLQQWSRDAEFYFLSSRTMKRWKVSTQTSKRDKAKAAYAQVRRMSKMNLAKRSLISWRQKVQTILLSNSQALEMRQNKVVIFGMNTFDRWRARAEEIEDMESMWKDNLVQKQLTAWKDRSSAFKNLEIEAIINYQERRLNQAIKKWSLQNLQQSGRSYHAMSIREKNVKKAFRKIFTYWQQRATQKRPFRLSEVEEIGPLGATFRSETWSDTGDEPVVDHWVNGFDNRNLSTPVPGYLSTPSRRAERVSAAAARFLSTTPQAPLSTPFERQLRIRYSGGPLTSARKAAGRSRLGARQGFEDIKNKAPGDGMRNS